MLEMTITIKASELAAAINNLAAALAAKNDKPAPNTTPATAPINPAPAVAPVNSTPTAAPANNAPVFTPPMNYPTAAPAAPLAQTQPSTAQPAATPVAKPAKTAVPTAAPQYTLEMIATAGAALVDAGKMDALCGLLAKYGIDSIVKLDPSQYGVFASELRALGAQI